VTLTVRFNVVGSVHVDRVRGETTAERIHALETAIREDCLDFSCCYEGKRRSRSRLIRAKVGSVVVGGAVRHLGVLPRRFEISTTTSVNVAVSAVTSLLHLCIVEALVLSVHTIAYMAKGTDVRHVAVAVVYDEDTRRILMVTSRKHDDLWIREEILLVKRNHG
jgi:hypothetical protein